MPRGGKRYSPHRRCPGLVPRKQVSVAVLTCRCLLFQIVCSRPVFRPPFARIHTLVVLMLSAGGVAPLSAEMALALEETLALVFAVHPPLLSLLASHRDFLQGCTFPIARKPYIFIPVFIACNPFPPGPLWVRRNGRSALLVQSWAKAESRLCSTMSWLCSPPRAIHWPAFRWTTALKYASNSAFRSACLCCSPF